MERNPTNPIASIFAWTRALDHRGKIDGNNELKNFARKLEIICKTLLNKGIMTKDLALMVGPDQKWLTTNELLDSISFNLKKNLTKLFHVNSRLIGLTYC